jgi:hypothetical protein
MPLPGWSVKGFGMKVACTPCESATSRTTWRKVMMLSAVVRASACWEGVRSREVVVPLVVEKVRVRGQKKEVDGSIAFVPTTQSWLAPMRRVWDGVLGSQDVNICR